MSINSSIVYQIPKETIRYSNGGKSDFYVFENDVVIIDSGICKNNSRQLIEYSRLTDKQNSYVNRFSRVYRFLEEDKENIQSFLSAQNENEKLKPSANREDFSESSPLEFYFEKEFSKVYGEESIKFLNKEFSINDANGNTFFLDYLVHTEDGDIAVEENGINYHHPQLIGIEKYRKQLAKQNECAKWGIKLYRFSTEDCQFEEKIQDDTYGTFSERALQNSKTAELPQAAK